jgi:hypothetical protein
MLMGVAAMVLIVSAAGVSRAEEITGQFTRIKIEHNVTRDGQKGMLIHVAFDIENAHGKQCGVLVLFADADNQPIEGVSKKFRGKNGQLFVAAGFQPEASQDSWKGSLFLPYKEIKLDAGEHTIKVIVGVICPEAANPLVIEPQAKTVIFTRK